MKITLDDIVSGFKSVTKLISNFDKIEDDLNNKVLYRDNPEGEPNYMQNDLDMNSYNIINQGNPVEVSGFNWTGDWSSLTTYAVGDAVHSNGTAYIAIAASTNQTPPNGTYWQIVVAANYPTQTGNANKALTTDGSAVSWGSIHADHVDFTNSGTGGVERTLQAKLEDVVSVKDFGAVGDGVTDDTVAIQAAIDYSQTLAEATFGISTPTIVFGANTYSISSTITKKSANWVGEGVDQTVLKWEGDAATVAISQETITARGGNSATTLEKMSFYEGSAKPLKWLHIPVNAAGYGVDFGFRLRELRFRGVTQYHIDVEGYVNLQWEHLRFDTWGEFAIKVTPEAGQYLSNFDLSNWTADHMAGSTGEGFLLIDNTAGESNIGTLRLANFRYENNTTLTGRKGFIVIKGNVSDCVQLQIENALYQDVGSVTTGDSFIYMDGTGAAPSVVFQNFNPDSLSSLIGGTTPSGWSGSSVSAVPLQYANIARQNCVVMAKTSSGSSQNIQIFTDNAGAKSAIEVIRQGESYPRVNIGSDGVLLIGDGSVAPTVVVRGQQAAVADATDAATAISQLNSLLAKLRTHGLIDT